MRVSYSTNNGGDNTSTETVLKHALELRPYIEEPFFKTIHSSRGIKGNTFFDAKPLRKWPPKLNVKQITTQASPEIQLLAVGHSPLKKQQEMKTEESSPLKPIHRLSRSEVPGYQSPTLTKLRKMSIKIKTDGSNRRFSFLKIQNPNLGYEPITHREKPSEEENSSGKSPTMSQGTF